jgi:hypothetical protein
MSVELIQVEFSRVECIARMTKPGNVSKASFGSLLAGLGAARTEQRPIRMDERRQGKTKG